MIAGNSNSRFEYYPKHIQLQHDEPAGASSVVFNPLLEQYQEDSRTIIIIQGFLLSIYYIYLFFCYIIIAFIFNGIYFLFEAIHLLILFITFIS